MQTYKQTLKEIQTLKEMFKDKAEQFPGLMQQLEEEERYFKNELEYFDDRNVQEIDLKGVK